MYPHARPPFLYAHFQRCAGTAKSYETFPILCINYESLVWKWTSPYARTESPAERQVTDAPQGGELKSPPRPSITQQPRQTSCDSELIHAKVLGQERSHIPLMWLARKIAQYGGASNSVLVDLGIPPHTRQSHQHSMMPKSKSFSFLFSVLTFTKYQSTSAGQYGIVILFV